MNKLYISAKSTIETVLPETPKCGFWFVVNFQGLTFWVVLRGRRVIKTGQIGDVYHLEGLCRFQIKDLFEEGNSNHEKS